jgi:cellobiose-specific phosphotransferase system component IIA
MKFQICIGALATLFARLSTAKQGSEASCIQYLQKSEAALKKAHDKRDS